MLLRRNRTFFRNFSMWYLFLIFNLIKLWFLCVFVLRRTLGVHSCQMAVCVVDRRGDPQKESCSITDINGGHWRFKSITNIHQAGYDKAFACCGHHCNCKPFYSSPTDYIIEGAHCCLFDHEREFRRRQRLRLAIAAMAEDCTRRPCEIVRIVKETMSLTQREEASLTQFVMRRTSPT